MSEQNSPQIGIARIYVKDLSFESPKAPEVFGSEWHPEIKLDVAVRHRRFQGTLYEVTLELTIEAREKQNVGFIVEIEQGGLFDIRGFEGSNLERALQIFCPSTLLPYARQNVDHALIQGGFAPLMLAPLNFEQLYRQSQEKSSGGNPPSVDDHVKQ
jgi:preprotein translocase subunit SecB